ncbi:MAG: hypothetical protein GY796_28615 [Chloroflexi bacterium]|nr:hypothetical protein [Chloroflexota bacterium]
MYGRFGSALKALKNGLCIAAKIEHLEYVVGNMFALGLLYVELFAPDQAQEQLEEAVAQGGTGRILNGTHKLIQVLAATVPDKVLREGFLKGAYNTLD